METTQAKPGMLTIYKHMEIFVSHGVIFDSSF